MQEGFGEQKGYGESSSPSPLSDVFKHFSILYWLDISLSRHMDTIDYIYLFPDAVGWLWLLWWVVQSPPLAWSPHWLLCSIPRPPKFTGDDDRRSGVKCERVWRYWDREKIPGESKDPFPLFDVFWHFNMSYGRAASRFRSTYRTYDMPRVLDEVYGPGMSQ